jgi:hypothetical protein
MVFIGKRLSFNGLIEIPTEHGLNGLNRFDRKCFLKPAQSVQGLMAKDCVVFPFPRFVMSQRSGDNYTTQVTENLLVNVFALAR